MLNKRKKTCYTSLGFIIQRIQSTQPLTRACVYSHLTLVGWPIPLDYHCSFPFFEIGDSHLSPAGRFRHGGSSGFGLMGQHLIFRIRKLLLDANTTWAAGCAACLHLCLCKKNKKGAACFLVTRWPGKAEGACWSKQNADAWGVRRRDVERRGASRWRSRGITSSLPTRQPWVLLHCSSECNRPGFFNLTTGACEHTSSPPWERRLSWQSQCLCLFFFTVPSCSSFYFILFVLVSCSFFLFFSLYATQDDNICSLFFFSKWKKNIRVTCRQGWLSKACDICHFSKMQNEKPGAGGTTNEVETDKLM